MRYSDFKTTGKEFHVNLAKELWGVRENASNFNTNIPKSSVGTPILLNRNLSVYTDDANPQHAGWPMLTEHLNFFDGDVAAGQYILDVSYIVGMGFLKTAPIAIMRPHPCFGDKTTESTVKVKVPMANKIMYSASGEYYVTKERQGGFTTVQVREAQTNEGSATTFDYYNTFDKSQITQPKSTLTCKLTLKLKQPVLFHLTFLHVILMLNCLTFNQVLFHSEPEVDDQATLNCGLKRHKVRTVIAGETLPDG
ncbi:hypothetical protein JTE90_002483 [Oedothorax gibbosus]|uniref:Uncharacterized protein n=1 Tax=Oedothorax gibbosus TaxID=931172 RepID=A0AAV6TU49_9ARAC|nr:hypothetical protein JTE90_002483 [Oedothorax gibbosus]